jgi:hypothetical protein
LILIAIAMVFPTSQGRLLLAAREDVQNLLAIPGAKHPESVIVFEPTRHSWASVVGQELASWIHGLRRSEDIDFMSALAAGHEAGAANAVIPGYLKAGNECLVRVSAQALADDTRQVRQLATMAPDARSLWHYILLHEAAHCQWDVQMPLLRAKALQQHPAAKQKLLQIVALHLNESYADTYAVLLMLRRHQQGDAMAMPTIAAVLRWRIGTTHEGAPHFTTPALIALHEQLQHTPLPEDWAALHGMARASALAGAASWLEAAGHPVDLINDLRAAAPAPFSHNPAPPRLESTS